MAQERRCPECGAPLGDQETCAELFHAALAMEWVDPPRTYAAHHLLVGTYMLQHPSGFTAEGQQGFAQLVITTVDGGLSGPELRERNRGVMEQQKRNWSLKAKVPAEPHLRMWRQTIADAINGPAEELPDRVWRWARSVRAELGEQGHG